MEKKLREYRAKQEKLNKTHLIKDNLQNIFSFIFQSRTNISDQNQVESNNQQENFKLSQSRKRKMKVLEEAEKSLIIQEDTLSEDEGSAIDDSIWCCSWLQIIYYILYFILWALIYMIFINLQFGTVYFILSALIFMYLNTGTKPKKTGAVSAYSVFNKNCVSIDGTLKAEQFEREIMFGAGSVR